MKLITTFEEFPKNGFVLNYLRSDDNKVIFKLRIKDGIVYFADKLEVCYNGETFEVVENVGSTTYEIDEYCYEFLNNPDDIHYRLSHIEELLHCVANSI